MMAILSDKLTDGAKLGRGAEVRFTVAATRDAVAHDAILTQARTAVPVDPVTGAFTTPNLDPGPYTCEIRWGAAQPYEQFPIEVPAESGTFRLWPLIDAGLPTPPPGAPGFVRNAGGIDRMEPVELADYSTHPKVPATLYILF